MRKTLIWKLLSTKVNNVCFYRDGGKRFIFDANCTPLSGFSRSPSGFFCYTTSSVVTDSGASRNYLLWGPLKILGVTKTKSQHRNSGHYVVFIFKLFNKQKFQNPLYAVWHWSFFKWTKLFKYCVFILNKCIAQNNICFNVYEDLKILNS